MFLAIQTFYTSNKLQFYESFTAHRNQFLFFMTHAFQVQQVAWDSTPIFDEVSTRIYQGTLALYDIKN